ncbi:MAG: hypothetical protein EOM05_08980 [Clostridia bacterium]|nr:hypothetical protein [Clostridia bacterium]
MLDNLIETAEDKPYAYILIAVEKGSESTNVGVQVNGLGLLLAQGLASFLDNDDYASLVRVANIFAAQHAMDDDDDESEVKQGDKLLTLLQAISGNK